MSTFRYQTRDKSSKPGQGWGGGLGRVLASVQYVLKYMSGERGAQRVI